MADVEMPRMSDNMTEGYIEQWLVADNSFVTRGQEIMHIETEKALMTYEAESDGIINILVPAGEMVAIGVLIATITEKS
jgi:pyruvate/2-oxoglutarate dehydrogenase complex dihydrolipoamide acyltransferase (E2) component